MSPVRNVTVPHTTNVLNVTTPPLDHSLLPLWWDIRHVIVWMVTTISQRRLFADHVTIVVPPAMAHQKQIVCRALSIKIEAS